jgi:hypothetical protein
MPAAVPITEQFSDVDFTSVSARCDTDLLGTELVWRQVLVRHPLGRWDWLAGYRYCRLYDGLSVQENWARKTEPVDEDDPTIQTVRTRLDSFHSENEFHGGELGLVGRWWGCRWAVQTLGKVALGGTRITTDIKGLVETTTSTNGSSDTEPEIASGGVLALPSNIGSYGRSHLAVMAELGVSLEYALTRQLRAALGYSLIYWSRVARVPGSVDLVVDTSQIYPDSNAMATQPGFDFDSDCFWVQGLSASLHYDF